MLPENVQDYWMTIVDGKNLPLTEVEEFWELVCR